MNTMLVPATNNRQLQVSGSVENAILGQVQVTNELGVSYLHQEIDFGAQGIVEIFQNIKYILLTEYFSVPLDREFGMNFTMIDKPIPIAQAMLSQEVAMKIAMYETRAFFRRIGFSGSVIDGKLDPAIVVDITSTEFQPSRYPDDVSPSTEQLSVAMSIWQ